jgi:hypothetical protein
VSACSSPRHPADEGGCPVGHLTPYGCTCDCHHEPIECVSCDDEFMAYDLDDDGRCERCAELVADMEGS